MRATMTISLPEEIKQQLLKKARQEKITVSALILRALKHEETLISEKDILKLSKKAKNDYQKGKTKPLKSLADLL